MITAAHRAEENLPPVPVVGFAAWSGTGKTTLLALLIPLLKSQGWHVGLIKKSHHDFEIDQPGKDSYVLRKAGASPVMLTSSHRRAIITEHDDIRERSLSEELDFFDSTGLDLILVEGYKQEKFPKIELHRPELSKPLLFSDDDSIIAIASDAELPVAPPIPQLDLNQPEAIAAFIIQTFLAR
ncbi:molybdopterin-guanine dinucleotide biosynthesis protein B [Methylococcus sp. EFPC2]|uniref:molybdopterin-guanine dinucleotide biosynthesis protein B n=1 Tax=Methylococcus sp. EFPC2 TaxID=2812648 RepID=UPI0019678BFE|nr:molybdopterin-guanine dinucleotide biosynthesis protein B [Methylococcus sp. EFPC2]QSA98809.1 molybdopterin-guanine dinucleotide biosynthesis protein B [Methylococcus sp. EFPC2]